MKRILVTGGVGFICSRFCDNLLEQGDEVICVDNIFACHKKKLLT